MIERHAASGGAERRAGRPPVGDPVNGTLSRASGTVWCRARRRWAVVSVVERRRPGGGHRYIQWCSLLGLAVECEQACLESFEETEAG